MKALKVVSAALQRARIVTLTGPVGSGKSLIAQRAAPRVTRGFAGGGKLIDVHELEHPTELLCELAHALDMPPPPLTRDAAVAYVRVGLQARAPTLFVLDGLDELLYRSRPTLIALLNATPQHRWLLTCENPIGLRAEKAIAVAGTPAPPVVAGPGVVRVGA